MVTVEKFFVLLTLQIYNLVLNLEIKETNISFSMFRIN